jgi:hypothetical protein
MTQYSALDKLLHRLALNFTSIAELSYDLDQQTVKRDPKVTSEKKHVFISGLARAGTTILMRRLYETGKYRSLTYRDMPFVLAPNLWQKLNQISKKNVEKSERAHGDRILVDIDSPESLDEVFWRVFDGTSYIKKTHLLPHSPDIEITKKYVNYINAILNTSSDNNVRYLSKNNNNILRLGSLSEAFPNSLILIPFREPCAHAGSLLSQHNNFCRSQHDDSFVRSYMTWLVHHEFGLDHRPFKFDNHSAARASAYPSDSIDYWLELWCETYEWLENSAPNNAIFVCYEDLCSDVQVWKSILEMADVATKETCSETFSLSSKKYQISEQAKLLQRASDIYGHLKSISRKSIQN